MQHKLSRYAAVALAAGLAAPLGAWAADAALPADQLVASIQAAVASQPGEVKEVDIERKGDRTIVKVEIRQPDGKERDVRVDAGTRQVIPKK